MFTDADFDRLGIVSNDGETLRRVAVSVPPSEAAGERFKEFEQIEFSSVTPVIPEPSTWVMMLLGFAGLGFVGYRAARKGSAFAAEGDAVGPEIASAGPRLRELRQPDCLLTRPPRRYSIAPIVSRAMRARALICLFRASPSAVKPPCFRAFRLPLGAPPAAPCIRQTSDPRTAGAWHCSPLRFDLARHLNA